MTFATKLDIGSQHKNSFDGAFKSILNFSYSSLSESELENFLRPSLKNISDPAYLKNIDAGIELFIKHFFAGSRIVVFGDYDVDGLTSASLWVRFFKYIDFENYEIFIPNRFKHGYGLSDTVFEDLLRSEPNLIITVDNGINSHKEVSQLMNMGLDVIITDHHTPVNDEFPDCPIINPKIPDCLFPEKDVCGVGVVYLFLIGLRRRLRELDFWGEDHPEPNLVNDLDLVTIGTIADQVKLSGLNRIFVHYGLKQITKNAKSKSNPFYSYLTALYRQFPNLRFYSTDTDLISYKIAPLLNAAGRVENGSISVNFLTSQNLEDANYWLQELIKLNNKRLEIQGDMFEIAYNQAEKQLDTGSLLLYDPSFHEGITGLLAGKFSREFNLPCVVLADMQSENSLKGSCRMPEGGSMLNILKSCTDSLVTYGGHQCAAGLILKTEALNEFNILYKKAALREYFNAGSTDAYVADFELTSDYICVDFYNYIKYLEPHGMGNPRPTFMVKNMDFKTRPIRGKNFLKWRMRDNVEAIIWNSTETASLSRTTSRDIIFEMKFNNYTKKGIQLMIKSIGH